MRKRKTEEAITRDKPLDAAAYLESIQPPRPTDSRNSNTLLKHQNRGGEYVSFVKVLDGYWEKPWIELPEPQRQAWLEALGAIPDDDGQKWDARTSEERKFAVTWHDYRHDPANARVIGSVGFDAFSHGYYGDKKPIDWAWWGNRNIWTAEQAACLIHAVEPDRWRRGELPESWAEYVRDRIEKLIWELQEDEFDGIPAKVVAYCDSKGIPIPDELRRAVSEEGKVSPCNTAAEFTEAKSTGNSPRWLNKNEVISFFSLAYKDEKYWENATTKKWPKRFAKARRGGAVGRASAEYEPLELATILSGQSINVPVEKLDLVFLRLVQVVPDLAGWQSQWAALNKPI